MKDQIDLIPRSVGPALLPSDDQKYILLKEDAVALLARYEGQLHLLATDPAYQAMEKHRTLASGKPRGTTTRLSMSEGSSNPWFPIFPDSRWPEFFHYAYRALVDDAHAYVMSAADFDQVCVIVMAAKGEGFRFWKAIPWDKGRAGTGYHWNASHEVVLFFEKGHRNLNYPGWRDWFDMDPADGYQGGDATVLDIVAQDMLNDDRACWEDLAPVDRNQLLRVVEAVLNYDKALPCHITQGGLRTAGLYPTEKPPALFDRLIANSSLPGEIVIDPFIGSGSCGEAALLRGRGFVGGDVVDDAITRSRGRLDRAVINFDAKRLNKVRLFKR